MKKRLLSLLLVFAFCLPSAAAVYADAPSPAAALSFDGHRYQVFAQVMTWDSAKEYCENLGGHLATISSQEEQEAVSALVAEANLPCWLGGCRSGNTWWWVTGEAFVYTNWDEGEPSNYFENAEEIYLGIYANDTDTEYSSTGKWNDFRYETPTIKGFVCEWDEEPKADRIELYADRPFLTAAPGDSLYLSPRVYRDGLEVDIGTDLSFYIEDSSVAVVAGLEREGGAAVARILAKSAGTTAVKVHYGDLTATAEISVSAWGNNIYPFTIHNVPASGGIIEGVTTNFYNFAGVYIDEYSKTLKDTGACDMRFNVFNTNNTYGIVEVYDGDSRIVDAVLLDKYTDNNTSIKESLWDNLTGLVDDIMNGRLLTYRQESGYSQKTEVSLRDVPCGGYIKITFDPSESFLLCLISELDIVLGIQSTIGKIAGFSKATGKEALKKIASALVADEKRGLQRISAAYTKELLKNVGDDFKLNASSLGSFAETISGNVDKILGQEGLRDILLDALADSGVGEAEKAFELAAGFIGTAMKGCFALGSTANLISECADFVDLIGAGAICIQVPGSSTGELQRVREQRSETAAPQP